MRGILPQNGVNRMSRKKTVPSYRRHKQSGQAIVTLADGLGGRRDVLLGKYGTAESRAEYARVLAEWESAGRCLPTAVLSHGIVLDELILAYWKHAEGYYQKNGKPTGQLNRIKSAFRPLRELCGHSLVQDLGPKSLLCIREKMVALGWTRGFVNSCVGCIKRMFKWGVEQELIPPTVFHGLQAVRGLKKGRSEVRETQPIRPVAIENVEAVLPLLTPPVRAMVQVQLLAGMRPSEVASMRPCDIDTTHSQTWLYRPESHKTEHHDIQRVVFLGPRAQAILAPFMGRDPAAYLFSPREAVEGYLRAKGRRIHYARSRRPGERYLVSSYDRAIALACKRAGVPHWAPNQLRHSKATEIRREVGLDAARAVLGHSSPAITEIYAELDHGRAAEVMAKLG
jgi:integrase